MTKRFIFILFVILTITACNLFAQKDRRLLIKTRIEPLVEKTMLEKHIPGLAIGIVEDGRVIYAKGFGVMKSGDKKPVTPKSLFHMASVTKPFVATAIMQLVEQDKINLDAHVTEYLPYFRMKDERFKNITVRQLLGHISGMPDVEDYHWDKPEFDDGALERYVRSLSDLSLVSAPGEKYQYSNMAFDILGDVIAKVSGESFESYVGEHILKPLKMKNSTFLIRRAKSKLITAPHIPGSSGDAVVSPVFPYNRVHAPSSTLYSNIKDMTRWAMANLNRGELNGRRILKAESYDLLLKPQIDATGDTKVGLSWFITTRSRHRLIVQGGSDAGFISFIALAPEDSLSVIVMSNFLPGDVSYVSNITNSAIDMLLSEKSD